MEIEPRDLGTRWHIAVVRYRALGNARFSLRPRIGRLGKVWASGLSVSEQVIATTLPMLTDLTLPVTAGIGTAIVLSALAIAFLSQFSMMANAVCTVVAVIGLFSCLVVVPRRAFHRLHRRPVLRNELEALKGQQVARQKSESTDATPKKKNSLLKVNDGLRGAMPKAPGDALETEFLSFVQDVLLVQSLSSSAEAEVRRVVHTMGDAVGSLPDPMLENDDLLLVKPSADSPLPSEVHVARAQAAENHRRLKRRTEMLRDELVAQIHAARTLLPTLGDDSASAATDFSRLVAVTATVQSIAAEATSVVEAQRELSRTLYPKQTARTVYNTIGEVASVRRNG